jgi:hypothetical protein
MGVIELFCPSCSKVIRTDDKGLYHSREFGYLCSRNCCDKMELKYARMILGKDSLDAQRDNSNASTHVR